MMLKTLGRRVVNAKYSRAFSSVDLVTSDGEADDTKGRVYNPGNPITQEGINAYVKEREL